jgi:hypothetical protein
MDNPALATIQMPGRTGASRPAMPASGREPDLPHMRLKLNSEFPSSSHLGEGVKRQSAADSPIEGLQFLGEHMKLLDDIIELLSDKNGSLTDAMLKTKVLMHKIGHKELAEWVNDELNGYPNGKDVPSYRIIPARLLGDVANAAWRHSKFTLPIAHLSEKQRKHFTERDLRESIHVLEEFSKKPNGHLSYAIQPEFYGAIGEVLDGGWIERAWVQIEITQVMNSLIEVRSRLLDFVLGLQDELGDVQEENMKEAAKHIDADGLFSRSVFGNNTTIQIGSYNTQKVHISVTKGDFDSLSRELTKHGVAPADVSALQEAIGQDDGAIEHNQSNVGPAVKGWMATMLQKAIDTSWQIELNVAAGLLTEALKAYYF